MHQVTLQRARRSMLAILALAATALVARPAHAATTADDGTIPRACAASPAPPPSPLLGRLAMAGTPAPARVATSEEEKCLRESLALGVAVVQFGAALATAADNPTPANLGAVVNTGAAVYAAGSALQACLNTNEM